MFESGALENLENSPKNKIKQYQTMFESGAAGSQETDGMLCPESRPRTVTCISAPEESSPEHHNTSNTNRQRSKSVRCRNQVGYCYHGLIYLLSNYP